jgi:invasion protein IalB
VPSSFSAFLPFWAVSTLFMLAAPAAISQESQSLPGGATSLSENYGDWRVTCAMTQNGAPAKVCVLAQQQAAGQSGQRLLAVEMRPRDANLEGMLVMPFGLALEQGLTLQVDDGPVLPLRFRTCLPGGCIVDLRFDAKTLSLLRKAATLKIKAVADGGRESQLTVSLKGFSSALDRTIALAK